MIRHWRLGLTVFLCGFFAIVAVFAFALPHLAPGTEAALTGRLSTRLSPSIKALFLAPEVSDPVPVVAHLAPTPLLTAIPAPVPADPPPSPDAFRLATQLRAMSRRDTALTAEIERHTRQLQPSLPTVVDSSEAAAAPTPTPEEMAVRGKIEQTKSKLASLLAYDTDQHPDVVSTREELLTLETRLQQLQIEAWSRRQPPPSASDHEQTAQSSQADEADRESIGSLLAARAAIRRQMASVRQQETGLRGERVPIRPLVAESVFAVPPAPPAPQAAHSRSMAPLPVSYRFTWLGAALFGSPFALILSLILALAAVFLANFSDPALRPSPRFRDSFPHPSS